MAKQYYTTSIFVLVFHIQEGTCRIEFPCEIFHVKFTTATVTLSRSQRNERGSSCFQFYSSFSCHVRGMRSRQSTRYFSKKISVTRFTNRITTWKSQQQWKRVGRLDEIEQVPTESTEQHDGNRIGKRHRRNSRCQDVDPLENGNTALTIIVATPFSFQRRSRGRPQ